MEDIKIILAFSWVAVMLIFLLGDVLRIFAGNFKPGEIDGKPMTQGMWFGMAVLMLIPIIMVVLSVILDFPVNGWVNIVAAGFFILLNLAGIKGYKAPDVFLLIVSMVINILTIWFAVTQIFP